MDSMLSGQHLPATRRHATQVCLPQLDTHLTKVHKIKKMRFRMDSPGMTLWSRTED